ncbi:NADAR domain-containing protein [Endozoicomonas numazuensis]|uniref:NADAR domain-containing protein n=1 Tax=Endozoicomonas numazuensis TaxID=1137799 RepID=UPI0009DEF638|nr:NADAR family protein [Endozoicomonas numazuensis]
MSLQQQGPRDALDYANARQHEWENPTAWHNGEKMNAMMKAVRAKAEQDKKFRDSLSGTGNKLLYENAPKDWNWGIGSDGRGHNYLGCILMQVRDELKAGTLKAR